MRRPDAALMGLLVLAGLLVARGRRGDAPDPGDRDSLAQDPGGQGPGVATGTTEADAEAAAEQAAGPVPGRPQLFLPLGGDNGLVEHGVVAGAAVDRSYELTAGTHLVGRDKQADLRLTDTTVSLRHAEITAAPDGRTFVRDLGAENGVRVDGWPVSTAELFDGDRLEIGRVELLFHREPSSSQDAGREGFDRVDGA
jgi:hypothetical protein